MVGNSNATYSKEPTYHVRMLARLVGLTHCIQSAVSDVAASIPCRSYELLQSITRPKCTLMQTRLELCHPFTHDHFAGVLYSADSTDAPLYSTGKHVIGRNRLHRVFPRLMHSNLEPPLLSLSLRSLFRLPSQTTLLNLLYPRACAS